MARTRPRRPPPSATRRSAPSSAARNHQTGSPPVTPQLVIGPGQHVLIIGQNRSGKSTLASRIAGAWSRVLVLDPKLDPAAVLPNSHIAIGVADALAHLPDRVVYRPTPAELDDLPGAFDELVRKVMVAGGGHGIVLHEVADVAPGRAARWLRTAWMQGGGLGVPVVSCTQRPFWIDRLALSEARHVFLFTLTDPDDRERAARLLGRHADDLPNTPEPHGFYYRGLDGLVVRCRPLSASR